MMKSLLTRFYLDPEELSEVVLSAVHGVGMLALSSLVLVLASHGERYYFLEEPGNLVVWAIGVPAFVLVMMIMMEHWDGWIPTISGLITHFTIVICWMAMLYVG